MTVKLHTLATGGTGVSGSPYTGWESGANAALALGRCVEAEAGEYQYSASIAPTASGAALVGESRGSVRFKPATAFSGALVDISSSVNTLLFRDFTLQGAGPGDGRTGIRLGGNSSRHTFERVEVDQIGTGIVGDYSWVNSFRDCIVAACGVGYDLQAQANAWAIDGGSIQHCSTAGLQADHGEVLNIGGGCNIAENSAKGIAIGPFYEAVNIIGNYFENNGRSNIELNGVRGGKIVGNRFGGVLGGGGVSANDAKLLADVLLWGCEGLHIGENSHENYVDGRQLAHILFYDYPGANTLCSLTGSSAVAKRSSIVNTAGGFPNGAALRPFYWDGESNKDVVPSNGGLFDAYVSGNLTSGQTVTIDLALDSTLAYDLYVMRQVSANNGEVGKWTIGRIGTSPSIKPESPISGISVSVNGSNKVVVTNTTGSAFVRACLTQRMPS